MVRPLSTWGFCALLKVRIRMRILSRGIVGFMTILAVLYISVHECLELKLSEKQARTFSKTLIFYF